MEFELSFLLKIYNENYLYVNCVIEKYTNRPKWEQNLSRVVYIALSQPITIPAKTLNRFKENIPDATRPCQLLIVTSSTHEPGHYVKRAPGLYWAVVQVSTKGISILERFSD